MIETLTKILSSEFFWGVIVGTVLAAFGGWLTVWLQERSQKKWRAEVVRTFSLDTVNNLLQTMRELQDLRGRTNSIQHDFLALLEVELCVQSFAAERMRCALAKDSRDSISPCLGVGHSRFVTPHSVGLIGGDSYLGCDYLRFLRSDIFLDDGSARDHWSLCHNAY
jgi:hypothetical protein